LSRTPSRLSPQNILLILHFAVDVKRLFELGKRYPWLKPADCPQCRSKRLWGHGYVERYFEGFSHSIWVKRYRCPDCNAVHTCRPRAFFKRLRYSAVAVVFCLLNKILHNRWLTIIERQNQQYWYRTLQRQSSLHSNIATLSIGHLDAFIANNIFPVKLTAHCETLRL
jgi:transposase-like protein